MDKKKLKTVCVMKHCKPIELAKAFVYARHNAKNKNNNEEIDMLIDEYLNKS